MQPKAADHYIRAIISAVDPKQPFETSLFLNICDASSMRFHDHHLVGYVVSDFGRTVTLNLVLDANSSMTPDSIVQFVGVASYQFNHSDGAIITDIREEPLSEFLERRQSDIESTARICGLRHWNGDFDSYCELLIDNNFRAWSIDSAIGFVGHIIAKSILQIEE